MWESPIEITREKISSKIENDIYTAIIDYGVQVDKDELIKALQYDRHQYEKGYADAKQEVAREIFEELDKRMIDITTEFSTLKAIGGKALGRLKKKYTESEDTTE